MLNHLLLKSKPVAYCFIGILCGLLSLGKLQAQQDSINQPAEDQTRIKLPQFFSLEIRPAYNIQTAPFYVSGEHIKITPDYGVSGHLKYGFAMPTGSLGSQIFSKTQQGIGLAYYNFGNKEELGNPTVAYLYQNAEITKLFPGVALGYEWNFGLSSGWKVYDPALNPRNVIVGSKVNAYINLGLYLKWRLSARLGLLSGIDLTHFSNGNTEYPNAGVNTAGLKFGLQYAVNNPLPAIKTFEPTYTVPAFKKHISYESVLFASWRRKGVEFLGHQVASPHKYPVFGFYFAPMYNFSYRFRTGISLDGIYDGSANVYTEDYISGTDQQFFKPEWKRQVALGLSARADYVMPIFTISFGLGANVLHEGGDLNGTYQSFALKIMATRSSFIHIGYNLKDFKEPNYLMLGIGYRFNNKVPSLLSK